jgi:carbon monoxide dehydrogenase subunit G
MKIESRIGKVVNNDDKVYQFISNFNNFKNFIPADKVSDFESTEDTCNFSVPGIGKAGLRIIEKDPNKLIKITNDETTPLQFNLWIQLKQVAEKDTRVKVTIKPEVNMMMQAVVKKPLKEFVDKLIDQIETFPFDNV